MTDQQQHPITPPHDKVYWWWEEACKRPPSSFYEKLDHVAARAAAWGWQQRAASVPGELQEARDEELEACCEWLRQFKPQGYVLSARLRAARRPKPPSLAEEALAALEQNIVLLMPITGHEKVKRFAVIRRALERLQELEGQQ